MIEPTPRFLHAVEKDGQTPETRTLIIMHELGGIANRISKAKRLGHENLFMADIKIDIGQAILQLEMLAFDLGLQPEECHKIGLETTWQHFKEWWGECKGLENVDVMLHETDGLECHRCSGLLTPVFHSGDREDRPSEYTCQNCGWSYVPDRE